jgi:ribosomal protein L17
MGIGVAIFIMVSGLRILKDTIASILGQGPTEETKNNLEAIIMAHEGVLDLHDLMVHDYGPHRTYASVHVEVDAGVDILLSHELIDDIERDILRDMGIHLIIHLDPIVTDDPDANKARELVDRLLTAIEPSLTFHDFRMVKGQTHSNLIFDMVVPFGVRMGMRELTDRFQMDLSKNDPKLRAVITLDRGSGSAPK